MRAFAPRGTPWALAWALAWVLAAAPVIGAPAGATLSSDIAPQSLGSALEAFGEITGLSVNWPPDMDALPSPGARAGLSLEKALQQLLRGTGLTFEFPTERSVRIYPQSEGASPAAPAPAAAPEAPLAEVLVTSPRWEERVVRTPIDLVVWTGEEMQFAGIKGIADIGARTPGVAFDFFSSVGSGVYTDIIIRGVTDRHGSATGVFFDDIPLPSARSNTFGRALPPSFDLRSIEVLRGPQGTLLGADTQGGAVRFVPNQPSLTAYTAQAHAEWAATERGDPSYEAGAAAGGPLVRDVLGFRFSAWRRSDGGYVDRVDPFTHAIVDGNANRDTSESVRGVLTYAPNPDSSWTVSPSINYVSTRAHDSPSFFTYLSDPGAGILDNGSLVQQPFDDRYYVGSLRIIGDTPLGQLDSRTSYYHRTGDLVVDDTESVKWSGPDGTGWGNPLGPAYPVSYANAVTTMTALRQSVLSQELRLVSHDLTWGASYYRTRDTEGYHVTGAGIPLFGGAPLDAANATHTLETRLAGFAEVSKRILRHFTLGAGLRVERETYQSAEDESAQTELSPYGIAPPSPPLHAGAEGTIVAPKLTLLYQSGRHDRYYLLAARGYAPAGVDAALPTCFEDLAPYPSDSLWNYELGANLWFLEGRLSVDSAVFEERWNNGAALTTNCLVTHIPGPAVSRGFNLKALGAAGEFLLRLEVSYTDAYYAATQSANGRVIVNAGDALGTPPLVVSPWEVLGSVEKSLALRDDVQATLRAEDAFHSHNPGPFYTGIFQPAGFSPNFYAPGLAGDPATNLVNLRASVSVRAPNPLPALCRCAADQPASFDLALYLNNAFDAQPTLLKRNKGVDASTLYYATTFRPRTVGLAATWRF
jgi:outer membrane receptor protein involved in Fe transport